MQTIGLSLHKPHPAQKQVLDCDSRFIVMMAGRRFGKSLISQTISIDTAVNKKRVAYITPTYQLGKIFFKEIVDLLPLEIHTKNESDLVINFITGGSIRFFTGERLDNLRGLKFHLAVIDEASFIPNLEDGWLNSIRPTLTDYKGRAIFLSTPRGKNYFFSLFSKAEPNWQSFKFTTYDNPYIDPQEIDDARKQLPEVVFEQEYMANPAENAANPFGTQFIRNCIHPVSTMPVVAFGIDLAKSVDWTVIIGLDENGNVAYFDRFQMDWHNTKQNIIRLPKCPILVDSTGVGDPILEDLQREGVMIQGLKFTSTSKQQLMEGLQSAIHQGKIGYPDGIISQELEIFEYQYGATGVKYSAPSGYHDDAVMSLALAWQNFSLKRGTGRYAFL
jgi:phage FluMu gp28-like protein